MTIPRAIFDRTILGFFEPIVPFFEDPEVSEVMVNRFDQIYIEKNGRLHKTEARFSSEEALTAALRNLSQYVGRELSAARPILEAHLPDGSRVEAIIPPASPDGPMLAVRRFFKDTLTIERLVALDSITEDAAEALRAIVGCKQNVLVAGGAGSGKTSLLNILASFAGEDERVVVIEDARELQLQSSHVVQLEAQPPDHRGQGEVTVRDLFKATLRLRPDRIVVGEIRGSESLDLIQAMTSGHGGCLSTLHATFPIDALNRLETMALMSDVEMPLRALRAQIASAINFIVQTGRLADGSRCVTHITEVLGYDHDRGYEIGDLFVRHFKNRKEDGTVRSELTPTGRLPQCAEMIRAMGFTLPKSMRSARRKAKE